MSFLSGLLGRKPPPEPEPEVYQDFRIYIEPIKEGGGFRLAARIEKTIDGEVKSHKMIRADTFQSAEQAHKPTLAKAKLMIDQRGDAIFG